VSEGERPDVKCARLPPNGCGTWWRWSIFGGKSGPRRGTFALRFNVSHEIIIIICKLVTELVRLIHEVLASVHHILDDRVHRPLALL
jgi:hypothetical protein